MNKEFMAKVFETYWDEPIPGTEAALQSAVNLVLDKAIKIIMTEASRHREVNDTELARAIEQTASEIIKLKI